MKNTLIKDTTLSIRCINCLHAADIRTTDDLKEHIEKFGIPDFVKFRHFGYKSIKDLEAFVEENKLTENELSKDANELAIEFANKCMQEVCNILDHPYEYSVDEKDFLEFIEQRNK